MSFEVLSKLLDLHASAETDALLSGRPGGKTKDCRFIAAHTFLANRRGQTEQTFRIADKEVRYRESSQ